VSRFAPFTNDFLPHEMALARLDTRAVHIEPATVATSAVQ